MNFKGQRIDAHNNWPAKTNFRAETAFQGKLTSRQDEIPFTPILISQNGDDGYQRCVGHLIDGLDALPNRPDYFFDHCFKVLDLAQAKVAPSCGIRGVMEKLPTELLTLDTHTWTQVTGELGKAIPRVTVDFLAKRLLHAFVGKGKQHKELRERAEACMGHAFYTAFCTKFVTATNGQPLANFSRNIPMAGSLLRLYLSGKPGTRKKKASAPILDVRLNPASAPKRMQVLLSLLIFTIRNERTHGAVISPFRTSKAKLERYESYYFLMLVAYLYALGTLSLRFPNNSVSGAEILAGCTANLMQQSSFFADTA